MKRFELQFFVEVEVAMVVTKDEAGALLEFLRAEQVRLFYVKPAAEFGMLGEGAS